uniref:Uncharacterized protein n=1 Tax=viral metagenome TaxID=1070528 RepID=A0A6C0BBE4_9ZZZZ
MSQPRNVSHVSYYIASQIPKNETAFKKDMDDVLRDLSYVPPEYMTYPEYWGLLDVVMKKHIPTIKDIDCSWKQKLVDIFIGKIPLPDKKKNEKLDQK